MARLIVHASMVRADASLPIPTLQSKEDALRTLARMMGQG